MKALPDFGLQANQSLAMLTTGLNYGTKRRIAWRTPMTVKDGSNRYITETEDMGIKREKKRE